MQINFPRFCRWKDFLQFFFFTVITLEMKQTSQISYLGSFWKTREESNSKIKIIGVIIRSHIKNGCENLLPQTFSHSLKSTS